MRAKAFLVLTFVLFAISSGLAGTQKVLYAFTGGADGGQPYAGVIFDPAGNLYGVTQAGGAYNKGTVFELSPSKDGWTETVLYSFTGGTDGGVPIGGLTTDGNGNLFGTASRGGNPNSNCGTLFELPMPGTSGSFTVLHTFEGVSWLDGCFPAAKLYYGSYNTLYGTTVSGFSYGSRFAFFRETGKYQAYRFSTTMGGKIWGGFNDWMFGASFSGGHAGEGVVYQGFDTPQNIYSFYKQQAKMGDYPMGELLTANVGGVLTMYGTASAGGAGGDGTVYALTDTLLKSGKWKWEVSLLHSFSGPDGDSPGAGLVADSAGNLYGTTRSGGTAPGLAGTAFELTPGPQDKWSLTTLYSFTGGTDGGMVTSGVVLDTAANLYGTASSGGAHNQGVVYEVTP
ncbi:MAG: choice-of-anchor tandem repeat GloVer-containing protein [Terriglobales bacterium]|jgi:uncharacterized repeat protein (TIGR03803 family)